MAVENWSRIKEIVDAAIQRPPDERAAFLDEVCDSDQAVRREVESLLSSFGRAGGFMEKPALDGSHASETEELTFLPDGATLGRYQIVRQLGEGGMGVVYLAKDQDLDRLVAIKLLNKRYEGHEENVRRFVQEAKAASALNHPNILTIYEIAEFERSRCIVSEYVKGRTLREILQTGKLGFDSVLDISTQIASALDVAHKARIIHRDIKPENIVIRDDGYVKILDFGLAKLLTSEVSTIGLDDQTRMQNQTAKGVILGTVNYMSPEQAKGEATDGRTDIFSLGSVMFEMISGRAPFAGNSTAETLANLIGREPSPISQIAPRVPPDLERIISKALRKDPHDRYRTMKDLIVDLKELKAGVTSGESKLPRVSKWESENVTQIVSRTTGNVEASDRRGGSWYLRWSTLVTVAVFLVIASAALWYWRSSTASSVPPAIKSLAVLPLKSLDPGENYLGLGIADALIQRISQTGALTVRPTSAVRRYAREETDALTAARQLEADAVLEGSVQRANDRLRVSVNLLRTQDGSSLWAESFDMRDADIFVIQDSVAQHVAARLKLHLDPNQKATLDKRITNNPVAYEYYLKGLYNYDLRGLSEKDKPQAEITAELFKKAIEVDPTFALAHAQLANIYAWIAVYIEPSDIAWKERAEEELAKAESLDPNIAEIHVARGALLSSAHYGWQTEAAIRELLEAQRLNPNGAFGTLAGYYDHIGLENLADREHRNALEVDPTGTWTKMEIRYYYNNNRRYDEYEAASRNFFPGDPLWSAFYVGKRRLDEAQAVIGQELAEDPNDPYSLSDKAKLLTLQGNRREAESLIPRILKGADRRKLTYHHIIYEVACNYALLGNSVEAVKLLREAAATGYSPFPLYERDQYLDPIRKSPEFIEFLAEMRPIYERRRSEFK